MNNNKRKVYFVGIGGISMSAIAFMLKNNGYIVEGSDIAENDEVQKLREAGIKVNIGHKKENITDDIDIAVYSKAIHDDNEEIVELKKKGIELISRSKILGDIMKEYNTRICVAGTHGKTTTTSIISKVLMDMNYDPTINIGGVVKEIGGNYHIGQNKNYFVLEACEYTNSFHDFFPTVSIITNVKADHLDFFKDLDDIRKSFKKFINLLPEKGILIINDSIENLDYLVNETKAKVITYGADRKADYHYENVYYDDKHNQIFDIYKGNEKICTIKTKFIGLHNVENILAAMVALIIQGIDIEDIKKNIEDFVGAKRRLEFKGVINNITFIDDYAHHPDEIEASIKALKTLKYNNMFLFFEPHTFTRTKLLFDEFVRVLSNVDNLILAKIYAAREVDTKEISSNDIICKIRQMKQMKNCLYIDNYDGVVDFIVNNAKPGDIVVLMGAGTIYKVFDMVASKL